LKRTLNCKGKLIDLNEPKVMGILNITPDSFYDKSRFSSNDKLLKRTELMLSEGATFVDIGAYSSRPGAEFVSEEEERKRLIPALEIILKEFPDVLLSVDTFRSNIARETIDLGASIINDISGGDMDPEMFDVVVNKQVPYILMHMRGNPQTMSNLNNYNHLIVDIISELQVKMNDLEKRGLNDIIIDPGLGFAKDLLQNYEIVKELNSFKCIDHPLLIGASRKSMIYKLLECEPQNALIGTTVVHTACLLNGASILRVHDVKEAIEAIKITTLLKK
jgi:dihydropteroate synthase